MFFDIISLQLKGFRRSPAFTQNLVSSILMGFFGLYFILVFVGLGAAAPYLLEESFPDKDIPTLIGVYFLYFIIYLFIIKLIFQNFGFSEFKRLLIQKFPKRSIIHFILTKSSVHWTNVIPLLGIIAYLISASLKQDYQINILIQGLVMVGLLFATNYKAFLFDKQLSINKVWTIAVLAIVFVINFLDFRGILPLSDVLEWIYLFFTKNIGFALIPIISAVVNYYLSYRTTVKIAYLEDLSDNVSSTSSMQVKSGIFSRFGKAGDLMELESKLILRNKRSRQMLWFVPFLLVYPLFITGSDDSMTMKFFVAIICTGGYAMTYGQLLLSWNSDHMDLLLTKMDRINDIFKAKYYLQCLYILSTGLLMIFWGFYKMEYFYLMPCMMVYNLGVVLFMYMFMASYNSKKINTNRGASMNYEGMSIGLFLILIPILAFPLVFYLVFAAIGYPFGGIIASFVLGLLGIIFHKKLIAASARLFIKNKYKIGSAFRAKS